MNFSIQAIEEINKIEKAAAEKMNCTAERWLDIAYGLDYISFFEKENISALIKKYNECKAQNIDPHFSKKNAKDLFDMREIVVNTIFPESCLKALGL